MIVLNLTDQQRDAVNYQDGSAVITACPGSGKTTVVKEKVRSLTPTLPNYKGVIGISFTNKASTELKQKCEAGGHDTKASYFGTIDSFCFSELIAPFLARLWGGVVADCDVVKKLSEEQSKQLNENYQAPTCTDVVSDHGFKSLYEQNVLWMNSFSGLALFVLKNSEGARRYIKARYTHVFVDEYQDSSLAQHELFLELVELGLVGIAVGDNDQSIYAFRGGDPKLLDGLTQEGSGFKHFEIDLNHRSHPSIVNYASRLKRPSCDLLEHEEGDVRIVRLLLDGWLPKSSSTVSGLINEWIAEKKYEVVCASDIAILAKTERILKLVSENLELPNRLYVDTKLDGIGTVASDFITALLEYKYGKIVGAQEICDKFIRSRLFYVRSRNSNIRDKVRTLRQEDDPTKIVSIVGELAELFDLEVKSGELEALTEILSDDVALKSYRPIDGEEVQIMTLHKSKGLEFKVVLHLGLEEWSFPYRRYTGNWNDPPQYPDLQQETNLHYVGITRAEELCVLCQCELRENARGELKTSAPSYFLGLAQLNGLYVDSLPK
ncbi:UvrD-helicase domain-containing protein [Vibrio sp. McD22-P3]|uniref:UvrD-helicase domain-containing protein n=1 Tax=Vibrio sp. McD22-P3 TaxID=2724880 RepID=UPI001F436FF9|nr:ATP-dependent helicase [Vibrio sp. McD22-P3]MCF4176843.1 ATP-dependent helicase [Vibrio sp. McD22-P3]